MTTFAVTVTFRLDPDRMDDFLPLLRDNARASVAEEPGCLRFDVCRPEGTEDEVFLYELYRDRAAFEEHLASAHFREFDAATRDMVAGKRVTFLAAEPNP